MVRLEKVNADNVWDIIKLHVKQEQESFVAKNEVSIIEAYTTITGGGHAFPFGIYDDDKLVGFLMIGFDTDDYWKNPPEIAKNNYNLWRMMIDERYQKKGYGRKAIKLALKFIETWPCGRAEYCWLSYEPENTVARDLYHFFKFYETGEMDEEEIIAVLKLAETSGGVVERTDTDKQSIDEIILYLTKREIEILTQVAEGRSNKEISMVCNISERTVKNHLYSIFKKLNVADRTQAALYYIKNYKSLIVDV